MIRLHVFLLVNYNSGCMCIYFLGHLHIFRNKKMSLLEKVYTLMKNPHIKLLVLLLVLLVDEQFIVDHLLTKRS